MGRLIDRVPKGEYRDYLRLVAEEHPTQAIGDSAWADKAGRPDALRRVGIFVLTLPAPNRGRDDPFREHKTCTPA